MSDRDQQRFWSKVEIKAENECWLWTGAKYKNGYGELYLPLGGEPKMYLAHRIAEYLTTGKDPYGKLVLHHCDNRACVNPKHLYVGTQKENIRDALDRGRFRNAGTLYPPKGEHNPHAKLTAEEVRRIRELHAKGVAPKEIAALFGMSKSHISNIARRWVWSHI